MDSVGFCCGTKAGPVWDIDSDTGAMKFTSHMQSVSLPENFAMWKGSRLRVMCRREWEPSGRELRSELAQPLQFVTLASERLPLVARVDANGATTTLDAVSHDCLQRV